jgi:pimeloyl-ACP methyl ester carboxylesterase
MMFIKVNNTLLNTVSFGKGPRTFLTHGGWVGNWEVWQQLFELMSESWRCVGYDHRGAGESPVPPDTITPEALVDDLFAVMDALEVERCVLGGESAGGFIALMAALRQSDRFEGLVLIGATASLTVEAAKPLVDGCRRDYPTTVKAFVNACVPEPDSEHIRRWGRDILLRAEPEAAARMLESGYEREFTLALTEIAVPTLVIHGSKDAIIPMDAGKHIADGIPDAELLILEGVGHVPTMTRPQEVVAAIERRFPQSE